MPPKAPRCRGPFSFSPQMLSSPSTSSCRHLEIQHTWKKVAFEGGSRPSSCRLAMPFHLQLTAQFLRSPNSVLLFFPYPSSVESDIHGVAIGRLGISRRGAVGGVGIGGRCLCITARCNSRHKAISLQATCIRGALPGHAHAQKGQNSSTCSTVSGRGAVGGGLIRCCRGS